MNQLLLCDEIFGENNFVGTISRATGTTTGQDANKIGSSLDYCVVYSKTDSFSLHGVDMDEKDKKRFSESDENGQYSTLQLRNKNKYDEINIFDTITVFKPDRAKEDILYEIMLKYGIFDQPASEIIINGKTMYRIGERHMVVCLEDKFPN